MREIEGRVDSFPCFVLCSGLVVEVEKSSAVSCSSPSLGYMKYLRYMV